MIKLLGASPAHPFDVAGGTASETEFQVGRRPGNPRPQTIPKGYSSYAHNFPLSLEREQKTVTAAITRLVVNV